MAERYRGDPEQWAAADLAAWLRRYAAPDGPDQDADGEAPRILRAAADRLEVQDRKGVTP